MCKELALIWLIYKGPDTCLTNLFPVEWGWWPCINPSHANGWAWHIRPHIKGHSHNTCLILTVLSPPESLGDRMNGITAKCVSNKESQSKENAWKEIYTFFFFLLSMCVKAAIPRGPLYPHQIVWDTSHLEGKDHPDSSKKSPKEKTV